MLVLRVTQIIIIHVIADDINGVIASSEKASKALFEWFKNNLSDAVSLKVNMT